MLDIHVIAINVLVNFCMNQCTSDKNCAIPGCAHVISSSGTCPATAPSARWLLYNSMPHPFFIQWVVGKVGQVRWGADPTMYRGEGGVNVNLQMKHRYHCLQPNQRNNTCNWLNHFPIHSLSENSLKGKGGGGTLVGVSKKSASLLQVCLS